MHVDRDTSLSVYDMDHCTALGTAFFINLSEPALKKLEVRGYQPGAGQLWRCTSGSPEYSSSVDKLSAGWINGHCWYCWGGLRKCRGDTGYGRV